VVNVCDFFQIFTTICFEQVTTFNQSIHYYINWKIQLIMVIVTMLWLLVVFLRIFKHILIINLFFHINNIMSSNNSHDLSNKLIISCQFPDDYHVKMKEAFIQNGLHNLPIMLFIHPTRYDQASLPFAMGGGTFEGEKVRLEQSKLLTFPISFSRSFRKCIVLLGVLSCQ